MLDLDLDFRSAVPTKGSFGFECSSKKGMFSASYLGFTVNFGAVGGIDLYIAFISDKVSRSN